MGQNPAVGGPNANMERKALERLEWLADPKEIGTEVFRLPAASSFEKEGSVTNSGRWLQWRWKAVEPPGEARDDPWILTQLVRRLKQLYTDQGGAFPDPVVHLTWDYGIERVGAARVAREVNGRALTDLVDDKGAPVTKAGDQVPAFTALRDDGSTAGGNWM